MLTVNIIRLCLCVTTLLFSSSSVLCYVSFVLDGFWCFWVWIWWSYDGIVCHLLALLLVRSNCKIRFVRFERRFPRAPAAPQYRETGPRCSESSRRRGAPDAPRQTARLRFTSASHPNVSPMQYFFSFFFFVLFCRQFVLVITWLILRPSCLISGGVKKSANRH